MEIEINIAEILKDKPQGIRLYSPIFGECVFCFVREETEDICVKKHNGEKAYFNSEGLYNALGEVMLFPSKELRDWLKFTWKKGDVLQHSEYPLTVIFESFEDDTYTSFKCKYCFDFESASKWLVSNSQCSTKHFYKVSEEEAKEFIRKVELNYNGKLNRETLEIEKTQPEFKDGDIVVYGKSVAICRKFYKHTLSFYVSLNEMFGLLFADEVESSEEYRFATESEKQQLFDALAKKGKTWDADKKVIVNLKPKWTPKPFDKVITRVDDNAVWTANIFSHIDQHGEYVTIGCVGGYPYCIPYNEETAKLLGTTDDWKGSEGEKMVTESD